MMEHGTVLKQLQELAKLEILLLLIVGLKNKLVQSVKRD
jgi:hypothetical protein